MDLLADLKKTSENYLGGFERAWCEDTSVLPPYVFDLSWKIDMVCILEIENSIIYK